MSKDPVFESAGKWFHCDEIWSDCFGPYDTEEDARKHLKLYVDFLNKSGSSLK